MLLYDEPYLTGLFVYIFTHFTPPHSLYLPAPCTNLVVRVDNPDLAISTRFTHGNIHSHALLLRGERLFDCLDEW